MMPFILAALILFAANVPASAAPDSYEFHVMIRPVETIKTLLKLHGQPTISGYRDTGAFQRRPPITRGLSIYPTGLDACHGDAG